MIWLDSVLATPIVGLRIRPDFILMSNYLQAIAPFLQDLNNRGTLNVESASINSLTVNAGNGFSYRLFPEDILVEFSYRLAAKKANPGKLPVMSEIEVKPFLELLDDTIDQSKRLLEVLIDRKFKIEVNRFGIVANVISDEYSIPPGINSLIDHLSKPWSGSLVHCSSSLTATLNETDDFIDRCIHTINFDEANPGEVAVSLDWQKHFKKPTFITKTFLSKSILEYREQALSYFQTIGEGNLNYE